MPVDVFSIQFIKPLVINCSKSEFMSKINNKFRVLKAEEEEDVHVLLIENNYDTCSPCAFCSLLGNYE
mgnify:CR=1 FL=1